MFNIISSRLDLSGWLVADLYAGSGALGLEALSRGADRSVFIEMNPAALSIARKNARELGVEHSCSFVKDEVVPWLRNQKVGSYGLILADPPYDSPDLSRLADIALPVLHEGGLFVLEHDRNSTPENHPGIVLSRRYGKSAITVFSTVRTDSADTQPDS